MRTPERPRRPPRAAVLVGLLGGLFALGSGGAAAQSADQRAYLQRYDEDGDGRVSLREFQQYLIAGFDARDHNGNGILDLNEQPPGTQRRPISRAARLRALEAAFRRQDRNGDGYLDARELAAPPG